VTDLLLNMVSKAAAQNQEFLVDLAALQVRYHGTAAVLYCCGRIALCRCTYCCGLALLFVSSGAPDAKEA
jgi:hypothetical protein